MTLRRSCIYRRQGHLVERAAEAPSDEARTGTRGSTVRRDKKCRELVVRAQLSSTRGDELASHLDLNLSELFESAEHFIECPRCASKWEIEAGGREQDDALDFSRPGRARTSPATQCFGAQGRAKAVCAAPAACGTW